MFRWKRKRTDKGDGEIRQKAGCRVKSSSLSEKERHLSKDQKEESE